MVALCDELDLGGLNRGPLAMGILTGKFASNTTFPNDDIRHDWDFSSGRHAELLDMLADIREVLTADGRTLVQGALGWILARSERTIPIPGFKTVQQVQENAATLEWGPLSAVQMRQIDGILGRNSGQ